MDLGQRGLHCLVPAVQHPLQKTLPKPEQGACREDVTQGQKGAGAEFRLLFTAGLNPGGVVSWLLVLPALTSEQNQALAQLIVLVGGGKFGFLSWKKNNC